MWWFYALLSALFASLTAIFSKIGVSGINSNLATFIRTMVILVLVGIITASQGQLKNLSLVSKHSLFFLVISGLATGLSWLFYFKAISIGAVSKVAPIDKLSVALTIVLAAIFLGEAITVKTAIATAFITIGALILVW